MPLQTWDEFLETLIQARIERGMTLRALAQILGVVPAATSMWERQERTPTQENGERWAKALGLQMPAHASLWFNRKEMSKEPRHGTRNGYNWHRKHNAMPACDPCKKAAAAYRKAWKKEQALYRE